MDKALRALLILIIGAATLTLSASSLSAAPVIHGFWENAAGVRWQSDDTKRDDVDLAESRLQLKTTHYVEGDNYFADKGTMINAKADLLLDGYFAGKTDVDLRELNISLTPTNIMDLKLGRQVLTWGTGDLLFINDLFPKDYVSFFTGRDDEYLKKPSDAIKISLFPSIVNVDMIAMRFEPNTTAKGDRLSFYDSFQGGISGVGSDRDLLEPADRFSNLEYALRAYRTFGSHEWAAYFFHGFDKNPASYKDELNHQLYYRRIDNYGLSVRGPFTSGIGSAEIGYLRSREDPDGTDRMITNSMVKAMAGYDRDLGNDLRIGVQYLFEQRLDYGDYLTARLPADLIFDKQRHLLTQRITKQLWSQTLTLSLFNFYSPSDKDGYVRPSVNYKVTDQWELTLGANVPWGDDDFTEFGQMKRNKNVYLRSRYSF